MKASSWIFAAVLLQVAGCAEVSTPIEPAEKVALRKILEPTFEFMSVPSGEEDSFYRALEAFAASRRTNEFIGTVVFISGSEIQFLFSNGGMHGGGFATLKKKNGRWVVDEKWLNV